MEKRIFKRFLTKSQKQENDKLPTSDANPDDYSLQELIEQKTVKLKTMYFEIIGTEDDKTPSFFNIHKKKYMKNGVEKTMIQIVDVSQQILYEQVHAENEFLAITNATVSHELRNPLQSISAQNLKIKLCLQEIKHLLSSEKDSKLCKKLKPIVTMIE